MRMEKVGAEFKEDIPINKGRMWERMINRGGNRLVVQGSRLGIWFSGRRCELDCNHEEIYS